VRARGIDSVAEALAHSRLKPEPKQAVALAKPSQAAIPVSYH